MASSRNGDSSSWLSTHTFSSNIRLSRGSPPFKLDKGLLAKRSAKIASLLEHNPHQDLTTYLREIQANPETLELIARFCHGFEVTMTNDNIIPLICLSHYLKMTETHSSNNLLNRAITFFEHKILPNWNHTIEALKSATGPILHQAMEIGLLEPCLEALSTHALSDPSLLGQPIVENDPNSKPNNNGSYRPTNGRTRRKLFVATDQQISQPSQDLTSVPLQIYELIIDAMSKRRVPLEYIAGSLYQYLKRHVDVSDHHLNNDHKQVIEVIEKLMPNPGSNNNTTTKHLFPCTLLVEMYTLAATSGVGPGCLNGLETRIANQLDQATIKDLLALDLNVESLRRILKGYYGHFTEPDPSGLVAVAELMEGYLVEVAKATELEPRIFVEVAEMVMSTMAVGLDRCSDGIYRAVDIYLDKHRTLSESEREEVCRILDFHKMSAEACDHAALNQRLPLRAVIQALFVTQLQLRDDVTKAVTQTTCNNSIVDEQDEEEEDDDEINSREDEELINGNHHEMRRSYCCDKNCKKKKKKVSLWKEVKRKFGCMGSGNNYEAIGDCNCQVNKRKKVHPK